MQQREKGVRIGHLKTKGATKIHIDQQGGACYTSQKGEGGGSRRLIVSKAYLQKEKKKHKKSILPENQKGVCYLCGSRRMIEEHHIFFGRGYRDLSEEHGMKVYLCLECHQEGPEAVHRCRETDLYLKRTAQEEFEKQNTRQQFIKIFGKSYL